MGTFTEEEMVGVEKRRKAWREERGRFVDPERIPSLPRVIMHERRETIALRAINAARRLLGLPRWEECQQVVFSRTEPLSFRRLVEIASEPSAGAPGQPPSSASDPRP